MVSQQHGCVLPSVADDGGSACVGAPHTYDFVPDASTPTFGERAAWDAGAGRGGGAVGHESDKDTELVTRLAVGRDTL